MQLIYMILYMLTTTEYYKKGLTKIGITSNIMDIYYNFEKISDNWTFLAIYNITGTNETMKAVYSNLDHPYDHLQHHLDHNWYQDVQPMSIETFLEKNHISFIQIKELIDYTKKQIIYQNIDSIHDFNHHFNLKYEL